MRHRIDVDRAAGRAKQPVAILTLGEEQLEKLCEAVGEAAAATDDPDFDQLHVELRAAALALARA